METNNSYFEIQCIHHMWKPKHVFRNPLWKDLMLVGTPLGGVMHEDIFVKFSLEKWYCKPSKSQTINIRSDLYKK